MKRIAMPEKNRFAYEEKKEALESRITAHSRFSDFNLHQWIEKRFALKPGEKILDIGCGNGNYAELFCRKTAPGGLVVGIDKNAALIEEARQKTAPLSGGRIRFLTQDFDRLSLGEEQKFDWAFAVYSLYYTASAADLLAQIQNLLNPGGSLVLIGPGPGNALELLELTERLTGKKPGEEHAGRMRRIASEFKPLCEKLFGPAQVDHESLATTMTFPSAESFGEYYESTLLWREAAGGLRKKELEILKRKTLDWAASRSPLRIQKEISVLTAKKKI